MREPLRIITTTGPARLPVSLNEARAHSNLGDDFVTDDALVMGYLSTAVEACQKFTGRTPISTTFTWFLDGWPSDVDREPWWEGTRTGPMSILNAGVGRLELPRPPLRSVTHVKTYDDSDNATTFASSNYYVDTASEPGRIVLRSGIAMPSVTRVANGLEVQFVAGYGDNPADVPEQLRQGIMALTTYLYENRGECPVEEAVGNSGASAMWTPYRLMRL